MVRRWLVRGSWLLLALLVIVGGLALRVACSFEALPVWPLVELGPVEAVMVFRDVRVFPATGHEFVEHQDVVVRAGRIEAMRPTGSPVPAGARVIEGLGTRTLMPGLIDAHVHVLSSGGAPWQRFHFVPEHNLEAQLYAGVTTVFDLGGFAGDLEELAQGTEAGTLAGPRIFHTGQPITAPGSHPLPAARALLPWPAGSLLGLIVPTVATPEQARAAVASTLADRVDYVKAICDHIPADSPALDGASLQAAIEEAHARGFKIFVHVGDAAQSVHAAEAGADVLAHGPRDRLTPEQVAALARTRVPIVMTMAGWIGVHAIREGSYAPTQLDRAITPPVVLDEVTGAAGARLAATPVIGAMAAEVDPSVMRGNARVLYEAGVPLLIGTDSALPGAYPGGGLHEELRLLHEAGVPVSELLLAATSRAAAIVASEPEFGQVRPGLVADLLLVEGDPREDIAATTRIVEVVRAGRVVRRLARP